MGFKYALAGNTSLRGEVKLIGGSGDVDANSAFSIGIHHAFGKARAASPAPAAPRDSDRDGVLDSADRCPGTGPGIDVDRDGCPRDDDGDGVLNADDRCPTTPAGVKVDSRGCPADSDRDGVLDSADRCPRTPAGADVDRNGCPADDDNDGVANYMDKCPNTTRPNAKINADGCYVVLTEQVTVELNVQFDNNSSDARPEHGAAVRRVFTFMQQYPATSVTIEGHTDSRGSAEYNRDLSQRRADTIADLLVNDFGIARSRVKAIGYGETRPIETNDTAEGRQNNRRVVGVVEATVER
jgi:OOP family OmpA-OmpF porin